MDLRIDPTVRIVRPDDPCICGRALAFRDCCLPKGARALLARAANKREHRKEYGQIRPVVTADFKGYRFVAVRDQVHYSDRWRTFHDFLIDYLKIILGKEWWFTEIRKPESERHPVLQWYRHLYLSQNDHASDEHGLFSVVRDGTMASYLLLAYDLYILRNHTKLQDDVLRRLQQPTLFRGARYELFVAAAFVRAGFDIEYEDESDTSRRHPEFVAVHRATSFLMSVEAKVRHRDLVPAGAKVRPGVRRLLRDAAGKKARQPFVLFLELALPAQPKGPPAWTADAERELAGFTRRRGSYAFDLVMFSNLPHQYGRPGEPDPGQQFYALWPVDGGRIPEVLIDALGDAAKQYGNVPTVFPGNLVAG